MERTVENIIRLLEAQCMCNYNVHESYEEQGNKKNAANYWSRYSELCLVLASIRTDDCFDEMCKIYNIE